MSELKWKTGPVPHSDHYIHLGATTGLPTFYREGYDPRCPWIRARALNDLPIEEPPPPPVTWYCHDSKRKFTEEDSRVHCMQNEHTVTLTQGDNTIILRGER